MKNIVVVALILAVALADFPHRTDQQLQQDMIKYDLDHNGLLSIDEVQAGSRVLHAELKLDLGEGFYPLLRQVMQDYMRDEGEMGLETYKTYRDDLESGAFNDLFGQYFQEHPPKPLSE